MPDQWSAAEVNRTVEEIRRRSAVDPEFRALAISSAAAAIAKINPRPLPSGVSVVFVDGTDGDRAATASVSDLVIVLPEASSRSDELSDEDLEDVAGGGDGGFVIRS